MGNARKITTKSYGVLIQFGGRNLTEKLDGLFASVPTTAVTRYKGGPAMSYDDEDESFYSRRRRTLSNYDPKRVQALVPRATELLEATDPVAVFERVVQAVWDQVEYGGMFNFFGALASIDDPRVTSFADEALQAVESELARELFASVEVRYPDFVSSVVRRFDELPRSGVIERAGAAYLAWNIAEYTKGIDPSADPIRYAEAKDKASAWVRWRRELKNRSTSEFVPIEDIAWDLSQEGHRLPAFAIALLALVYRGSTSVAVPEHYFWTYYISTAHSLDAAAFFLKELQPPQTHDFLRRLLEEARFSSVFPPELDNLRYTPHAAKHFRAMAAADPELASEFGWMLQG